MDFAWSDEQRQWREKIAQFAQAELNHDLIRRDQNGEFHREGWKKCAAMGIHGLPIPAKYGGVGADVLTTIAALEGLGYGCHDNGLTFSINAHMWACETPLLAFGNESQKERYLPKLCSGEWIGAHATTEPDSGSDAYSLATTAERKGDRYVLNGCKTFVSNGAVADVMVVLATVDRSKGAAGITGFLVEKGFPGMSVARKLETMGLRTAPVGEVTFDDCEVPEENRLGKEGAGFAIFNHSMEWERAFILANAIGAMERQLEACLQYAKQRKQFGQPIGKFQLVATKLVDMKLRLETARGLMYRVAWLKQQGKSVRMEAAMAKLHISESWVQSCLDAMQVHGGYGYRTDYQLERDLRDAIGSRFYSGTSEIQRVVISQLMGL